MLKPPFDYNDGGIGLGRRHKKEYLSLDSPLNFIYIKSMDKLELAEKILQTLERQTFNDWYNDPFEDFIGGIIPPGTISYEEQRRKIIADIIHLFKL